MAKKNMTGLDMTAKILLIIGGLNWGIIGLLNRNVIDMLPWPMVVRVLYVLVGASALWLLWRMIMGK